MAPITARSASVWRSEISAGKVTVKKTFKRFLDRIRRIGRMEVLVLGDSHAEVFEHDSAVIPGFWYRVVSVGGATISGLKNPNSATQAMPIFQKALRAYKGKICILHLGEVDTGFVIWYRALKHNLDIRTTLETAITNYIDFIKNIPADKQIIIVSTPLPTIRDGQTWGEVASLRKEVKATQRERTELTVEFNSRMERIAKENGIAYLNLDALSLNEDGVVQSNLLNSDPYDHHYDHESYVKLLKPGLTELIKEIDAADISS